MGRLLEKKDVLLNGLSHSTAKIFSLKLFKEGLSEKGMRHLLVSKILTEEKSSHDVYIDFCQQVGAINEHVILDFKNLNYFGLDLLESLISLHHTLSTKKNKLVLVGLKGRDRILMELFHLKKILPYFTQTRYAKSYLKQWSSKTDSGKSTPTKPSAQNYEI